MTVKQVDERARLAKVYQDVGAPLLSAGEFALTKVFMDYKAWDAIPDDASGISVAELADKIGGTHELLERITTFFIARGVLASPAPGSVAHTDKSRTYKSDQPTAWVWIHMFNNVFRSFAHLPSFFAKHGLASPSSVYSTPLGLAHGHDGDGRAAYDIIVGDKKMHKGFNEALREIGTIYSLNGVYDFGWMRPALLTESSRPALVDIGGSHGLALRDAVRSNKTFLPASRCAVFDLPEVVANTQTNIAALPADQEPELKEIQLVGGSMFSESYPDAVRGALAYQFRRVLNDFPDGDVVKAMRCVRAAAAPDSRLLVIEEMLNPNKRLPLNSGMDIALMMAAGKRRNAAMFGELAAQAGWRLNAEFMNVNAEFDDFGVLEFVAV